MITGDFLLYSNATTVHPIGLVVLVACVIYLLFTDKNKVILPILFMLVFIPSAQRVVIFSIDFSFIRILILVALFRIFLKGESSKFKSVDVDMVLFFWAIWSILAYGILTSQFSGLLTRTGYMVDAVGGYLVGRAYIYNIGHLKKVINFLGIIAIPVAVLFLVERASGNNLFAVFGGVPFETLIRAGRLRCQGPFSHPIMAGIFWASVLPWLGALWFTKSLPTKRFILYSFFILIIIINTASSTPVMSVIFVALGFALFRVKNLMPLIRVMGFCLLIALQIVMKNGVFHLIARIDIAGGSTGYHRYNLINKAFEHFDEWWMVGTLSTSHWGWGLTDITNQYILEGIRGGILAMILFVLIIVLVFRNISRKMREAETINDQWLLWSVGTLIFMHTMNYLAVSYFGQLTSATYLFLGASVSLIMNDERFSKKNEKEFDPTIS